MSGGWPAGGGWRHHGGPRGCIGGRCEVCRHWPTADHNLSLHKSTGNHWCTRRRILGDLDPPPLGGPPTKATRRRLLVPYPQQVRRVCARRAAPQRAQSAPLEQPHTEPKGRRAGRTVDGRTVDGRTVGFRRQEHQGHCRGGCGFEEGASSAGTQGRKAEGEVEEHARGGAGCQPRSLHRASAAASKPNASPPSPGSHRWNPPPWDRSAATAAHSWTWQLRLSHGELARTGASASSERCSLP